MRGISILRWVFLLLFPLVSLASSPLASVASKVAQPTACLKAQFTVTGSSWKSVTLNLQNHCGQTVDVRNTTITFNNPDNLNTAFWGNFGSVSYPDNNLQITSTPVVKAGYLSKLYFHIPEADWANSKLPDGGVIQLSWSAATAAFDQASVLVYLDNNPTPQTGSINLTNSTAKPADVTQAYAPVDLVQNGQVVLSVQLPCG